MGAFCLEARSQCDILLAMITKMEALYSSIAEYFVFDAQKYSLEEFMSDIKTFKIQFKACLKKDCLCGLFDSLIKFFTFNSSSNRMTVYLRIESRQRSLPRLERPVKNKTKNELTEQPKRELWWTSTHRMIKRELWTVC